VGCLDSGERKSTFVDPEPAGPFAAAFQDAERGKTGAGWLTCTIAPAKCLCEGLLKGPTEGDMDTSFAIMINLPESLGAKEARKLVRELKTKIKMEPSYVILDLSRVKEMDSVGLDGLLVCIQEIARHDCAIQLRAISPEAATFLELARMDRLLQKFASLPGQAAIAGVAIAEAVIPEEALQLQPVAA